MNAEGPLRLDDSGAIAELREVLMAAGVNGERVRSALGATGDLLARAPDVPVSDRRLDGAGPLATLIKLFLLQRPVTVEAVTHALAPLSPAHLERLGLAEVNGGEVRALVRIAPHDEILITSDSIGPEDADRADHVAGVHPPSLTLSHLTVRRPVETALDVGTGSGIQAILASRHSNHVVATDLNERALNLAGFNALLNGVENVEFRAGSFFEPVAGERFDLVTSNPPYVISPESAYLFRDSGLEGDSVSRDVVRAAPTHLEEGGFATLLVSWIHPTGQDWSEPLKEWIDGSGCDAWLLHYGTDDPLTHTAKWNQERFADDPAGADEVIDRWLEYLKRLGIEGIAYGAVILRRRSGRANWIRADELPADRLGPAGAHILRVFAAQDYLAERPEEADLLDGTFALAAHDLLEQRVQFRDSGWVIAEASVSLQDGLGFRAGLDPMTVELLAALDGTRKLGRVVEEVARRKKVDRTVLERDATGLVRGMLGAGFLEVRSRR
jgi:methylase of polypeptide subunit release factors